VSYVFRSLVIDFVRSFFRVLVM